MAVFTTPTLFTSDRFRRQLGLEFANRDVGNRFCDIIQSNLDSCLFDPNDRWATFDIPAGTATSVTTVFTAPFDMQLKALALIALGSFSGIDASHTLVVTVKQGTHAIASVTYNNITVPTNSGVNSLGALDGTYKTVAAGTDLTLTLTVTSPVAVPATRLVLRYGVSNPPTPATPLTFPLRVIRVYGEAIGNHDQAKATTDAIAALGAISTSFRPTVTIPLPDQPNLTDWPLFSADAGITLDAAYLVAQLTTIDPVTLANGTIDLGLAGNNTLDVTLKQGSNVIATISFDGGPVPLVTGFNSLGALAHNALTGGALITISVVYPAAVSASLSIHLRFHLT